MNAFVLALALLAPASAKVVRLRGSASTDEFAAWKAKYAKHYATPAAEQAARTAFLARSEAIAAHNAGGHTYEVGHNQFSDLTPEQFRATMLGGIPTSARNTSRLEQHVIPADFDVAAGGPLDWVAKGAVTPVKNQGQCGSCWAFSTTGAMEGALFAATGSLLSLSEEQLVQCDSSSYGCNGGFPSGALSFVASNGGVCAESDYAYTSGSGQTGSCRRNACASVMTVEGSVAAQGEQAMLSALQQRPLSILIDAEDCNFQSYRGGIIDNYQCGSRQDHAVLLVGYGTENGVDYWKVKNSWASSWGENGYFRVVRNKNMLGLGSGATYAKGARLTGSGSTKYACANNQCVPSARGQYATEADCAKSCGQTPSASKWGCWYGTCYENPYGYFHDKASCDGYCGSAPTTKKYACANDQCVESASGAYADVASCEAACGSPGPSVMKYACDAATKTCALAPGGAFWAKADCESSCGSPEPSTKYACSDGQCVENAAGSFADYQSCEASCASPATKYACSNGQCVEAPFGAYADYSSCHAQCSTPPGPTPSTCAWKADTGLDGVNAFITTVADEAACCEMCHLSTKCEAVSFVSGACYGFTAGFSLSAGLPGISAAVL